MRRRLLLAAGAGASLGCARPAVKILVAYPPGGVSDQVARVFARSFAARLGTSVVVDNRPGGGGSIALGTVARAAPDGSTLGFCAVTPLALTPHQGAAAPPVVPVSGVMHTPLLLVGTSALRATDFYGMVAEAKARDGALRWATSGAGTLGHFALQQVAREFGIEIVHVPYTGGGPQLQDALAGRFELLSSNLAPMQLGYVREGRLKPLALGAPLRTPLLPRLPTFAELNCPTANLSSLFGLFAPQGTPRRRVAELNGACAEVLAEREFRTMLDAGGNLPAGGSEDAFAREIARQSTMFAALIAAAR